MLTQYNFSQAPDGSRVAFTSPIALTANTPVFRNGILQGTADYSFSGFTATFTAAPASGDNLAILGDSTLFAGSFSQTPNGVLTAFTASLAITATTMVFRNGVLQGPANYSYSGFTATFAVAPATGDKLALLFDSGLVAYALNPVPDGSRTSFTAPVVVTGNSVLFRNGILEDSEDFSSSSATVTFVAAPAIGDNLTFLQAGGAPPAPAPASIAYPGYGSSLSMSLDGGNTFTRIAQLKIIEPQGSKLTLVDSSTISDPDNYLRPLAVRVDAGEIAIEGVAIPSDSSQLSLATAQSQLQLNSFLVVLTDGTQYVFQAWVSEYQPFKVQVKNAITFSAKLTVVGGGLSQALIFGGFDPAAFDPNAFSTL